MKTTKMLLKTVLFKLNYLTNTFLHTHRNVLSTMRKSQIISSYSDVLADIVLSSENYSNLFIDVKKALQKLSDVNNFIVNPFILAKYKNAVANISKEVNDGDELQKFLLTILKRRYVFLLPEIIKNVEAKLQDKINSVKVCVYSRNQLSLELKKSVESEINKQLGNVDIEYKISRNIPDESIDFISNGNICSLNLKELSNKFLDVF